MLESAYATLRQNVMNLTLDEALFVPPGGFRSTLGTLKHAAAWSHVYRSFAFDHQPIGWYDLNWPHGLRDTVLKTEAYLREMMTWLDQAHTLWLTNLQEVTEEQLNQARPVHWGDTLPLYRIIWVIAEHHLYHAGEINQLLSIYRGEAWEEGEEVEENNVSTVGHRVIPPWQTGI
jgi:hypothetical protein